MTDIEAAGFESSEDVDGSAVAGADGESIALLDALLAGAPVGLAFVDRDLRFVRVNEHLAAMSGRSAADHVGRTLREAFGEFADRLEPTYRRVLQTGEPVLEVEMRGRSPGQPEEVREWQASYYPVRGPEGGVLGVGLVVSDVTDRRRQEARLRAQYAVQRALADSNSLRAASPRILGAICETLGWDVGAIWLVSSETGRIECFDAYQRSATGAERFVEVSRSLAFERGTGLPGRVWAEGKPLWVPDVVADPNFPRAKAAAEAGLHGALAFPISMGKEVDGAIEFFSREVRRPDPDLLEFVTSIGGHVGQFIRRRRTERERVRALERERAARKEGEAANLRLRTLQRVTEAALAHVGLDDLLADLLPRVQQAFAADAATVLLSTEDGKDLMVRAAVGRDMESIEALRVPLGQGVAGRIAADRRPLATTDIRQLGPVSSFLAQEMSSLLGVPMLVGDRVIGVLHVATKDRRQFSDEDVALLELVADRVALAVEQAHLYEGEQWARREAERAAERTAALQRVTAALAEALSPLEVARVVIEQGCATTGASSAWIAMLDESAETLDLLLEAGYAPDLRESMRKVRLDADLPLSEAVRTGSSSFFTSRDELIDRFPGLAELSDGLGRGGLAVLPLAAEGRRFGAILFGFPGNKLFDSDERSFLRALTQQCSLALERTNLYARERRARAEAEAARARLTFLLEATTVLSSSLDFPETLEELGRVAVSGLADICLIDVLSEEGTISRVAAVHADPSKQELTLRLREKFAPDPSGSHPAVTVMRTGRSQFSPEMTQEFLRATTLNDEHFSLTQELGFQSYMCVPLTAHGRILGTVTLVSTRPERRYGEQDLALAEEFAGRAALAVDNARLYRERDYVARTLQEALLPPEVPGIPGMDVAARYRPAGEGNEVGGDFYDVYWASGGWGLMVGDVRGKGPDAAAVMGMIRHSLRAAALQDRTPSGILRVVNGTLRQQPGEERFATLTYVRLEAAGAGVQATVCSGGHPLPLLLQRDGSVRTVGGPGMLLGPFPDPILDDHRAALSPGDTLLLYTDGVTERRSGDSFFGERRLIDLLRDSVGLSAQEIVDAVEREVEAFGPEEPRDDIALLAAKVTDWGVAAEPPRSGRNRPRRGWGVGA